MVDDGCTIDVDAIDRLLPSHADRDLLYQLRYGVRVHNTFLGGVVAYAPHASAMKDVGTVLQGLWGEVAAGEHDVSHSLPYVPLVLAAQGLVPKPHSRKSP